ncbi:hypothetical protein QBC32DRAFT_182519, partial [Pseudoneurospora amorphoporcata]
PGFHDQDPKSPPNGFAYKIHRARKRNSPTGGTLAVTQHNDNKNRDPQVSFSGTVTPLKLLRHCE